MPEKKQSLNQTLVFLTALVSSLLGIFISPLVTQATPSEVNAQTSLAPIIKKTMPSVVVISGYKKVQSTAVNDHSFSDAPYGSVPIEEYFIQITGSGVIYKADKGLIITNAHVIENLDEVKVTLSDKRKFDAKILGKDKATDLALLQINTSQLSEIHFADSDDVEVGDNVVAIGNPLGNNHSVTSGIVSALGRNNLGLEGYYDYIQTDAAINIGNSGGPLLDTHGHLIGINTVILAPSGGNIGLGFAIPSNMAKGVISQLLLSGKVNRGPLGVLAQPLTPELAEGLEVDVTNGALVTKVFPDTPAATAGLEVGDIILQINNKSIRDSLHLRNQISIIPLGESISISVLRNKKTLTLSSKLVIPPTKNVEGISIAKCLDGGIFEQTTSDMPFQGILISHIDKMSLLNSTELRMNDIIVNVNKKATETIDAFKQAVTVEKNVLLFQVIRQKQPLFVAVKKVVNAFP